MWDQPQLTHLQFIEAVKKCDFKAIKRCFERCASEEELRGFANAKGARGQSALVIAIRYEFPNLVALLLRKGARATVECEFPEVGTTPLRVAFQTDRPNIQRLVVEAFLREQLDDRIFFRVQDLSQYFKPEQEAELQLAQRVLIKTYAGCDASSIASIVSRVYFDQPAQTLYDLLTLAVAMEREARGIATTEPLISAELKSGSLRLQLLASGCLS